MPSRLLLLGVALAACTEPDPGSLRRASDPVIRPALTAAALAAVAARADVVALDGDVALVCGPAPAGDGVAPACDAAWVGPDGALTRWGRGELLAAVRLDAERTVLLTRGRELVLATASGERVLARGAADPRVAPDRRAVVFTELRGAGDTIDPSTTGRLVVLDLDRGTRRVVTDHPLDSAPFLRPGGSDVLFVSARTGVASLWLARAGQPPRQVTNRGARTVGAGFVPVPGRELVWLDDGDTAVFTATYDGAARLWAVDVEDGRVAALGPGRLPRRDGGAVIAIGDDGAARRLEPARIRAGLGVAP